jgi:biopolymer transport protein ExbD
MVRRPPEEPHEIVLPITPFLDMAFQLLFFFLATFNPPSTKEGQMDLSLPAKSDTAAQTPDKVNPASETHKEELDDKAIITVKLRGYKDARNRGLISYFTVNTDNANDEELKGSAEDREKLLKDRLEKAKPASLDNKDGTKKVPTVRMAAESDVRWSQVMRIMDICYKCGYQVSFIKPPDLGGGG